MAIIIDLHGTKNRTLNTFWDVKNLFKKVCLQIQSLLLTTYITFYKIVMSLYSYRFWAFAQRSLIRSGEKLLLFLLGLKDLDQRVKDKNAIINILIQLLLSDGSNIFI